MSDRLFLQRAEYYNANIHADTLGGWFLANLRPNGKLAFWDGGVSAGLNPAVVPYAHPCYHDNACDATVATGMWSKSGRVLPACDLLIKLLPPVMCMGTHFKANGLYYFDAIQALSVPAMFADTDHVKYIGNSYDQASIMMWVDNNMTSEELERFVSLRDDSTQEDSIFHLLAREDWNYHVGPAALTKLPVSNAAALETLHNHKPLHGASQSLLINPSRIWAPTLDDSTLLYNHEG